MLSQETFNKLINDIELKKQRKENGLHNSILSPFTNFNKNFPGLERGKYILLTANSGIGKTKFAKFFFVNNTYNFCKKFNIPLKIYYFALEETKNNFWLSVISIRLFIKFGINVDSKTLNSIGSSILTSDLLFKIKSIEEEVKDMMNYIEVIDNVSNGFGIYKHVKKEAEENGIYEGTEFNKIYKPNDPEEYKIVMTDHISLLSTEKDNSGEKMNHHQSMGKFSQEYCLKGFCKKWNYITVNVQQQEAAKEKQEYTFKGNVIEDKIEPSLDGLANNKEIQRDVDFAIGLFAPDRYKIENYRGYDITKLKDNYRALKILKDRNYGLANGYLNLYFDGATNIFKELPNSKEINYKSFVK
jgi:replicative DNA helicase